MSYEVVNWIAFNSGITHDSPEKSPPRPRQLPWSSANQSSYALKCVMHILQETYCFCINIFKSIVVSAHRPLVERLMHMAHKSGNTSGVSKSSSDWLDYTGFPGDVCRDAKLLHERRKPSSWEGSGCRHALAFSDLHSFFINAWTNSTRT